MLKSRKATTKEKVKAVLDNDCIILHETIEHEDGSATFQFEINNNIKKIVKKYYKRKRFTEKLFERFVIEGLTNYLEVKNA